MARIVVILLLTALLEATCIAATTYTIYSYYAGTDYGGNPYAVYANEDADCSDFESTCSAYDGSASGTTIEKESMECTTDYVSAMRAKFSRADYILEVTFFENTCTNLYYAYGVSAVGNCVGSFKNNTSLYIIGMLDDNGSASIEYYDDSYCSTNFYQIENATKETLTTHSCDVNNTKWYTSNDNDASSSGSSTSTTSENSSGLSTGALVGIINGCVVVLLLIIGVIFCLRRRQSQGKRAGQWTATLPSGDLTSLEAAMSGQMGLWNDDVITAKRIPRDKVKIKKLLSRGAYGEVYTGFFNGQQVAVNHTATCCPLKNPGSP